MIRDILEQEIGKIDRTINGIVWGKPHIEIDRPPSMV